MAAPKIKLYRLSRDFTTDSLNRDKKTETNDELLPVFDKYVSPDDILAKRYAVGILPSEGEYVEELSPILAKSLTSPSEIERFTANLILRYEDYSNSQSVANEISNSFSYSGSNSLNSGIYDIALADGDESILGENFEFDFCMNEGVYPIVYTDGGQVVPSDGWIIDEIDGVKIIRAIGEWRYSVFGAIDFVCNIGNVESSNSASLSMGLGHNLFCSKYAPIYSGGNTYFSPYVFVLKDGVKPRYRENIVDGISVLDNHDSEMVFFVKGETKKLNDNNYSFIPPANEEEYYFINPKTGEVVFSEKMAREIFGKKLYIKYVSLAYNGEKYKDTKRFVADSINLIPQNDENGTSGGHLFMGPDVFLGRKQYEPSSYESDTGEVITIGIIPAYVEPGNYNISHRNGYVTFPAKVNSNPKFNTADHAWNIDNLSYTKNGTYTTIGGDVHISHAHVCCVENVNHQIFEKYYSYNDIYGDNSNSISASDIVELRNGDIVFRASPFDYRYSKSIGAPWVNRNSVYMPTRVYVTYKKYRDLSNSSSDSGSGLEADYDVVTEVKPQIITINDYDELRVKTSE